VALKGLGLLATAYPEAAMRPMHDLDFLLPTESFRTAFEALTAAGWSPLRGSAKSYFKRLRTFHALPVKGPDGIEIDLHRHMLEENCYQGADDRLFESLSGVSLEVVASIGKTRFREAALFTHRGLSGPAILQISSYWRHGDSLSLDLLPDADAAALLTEAKRARPNAEPRTILREHFPDRLADVLSDRLGLAGPLVTHKDQALVAAGRRLGHWLLTPSGSEGFAKAEVTIGGVATDGLDQRSLAAKRVPGLHFIGEAVDVTGWLGGYNFQWGWASGAAAGEAV